ncbi:zinc finger BED domain-containing protein RICESLEEPER 1-like [Wolffia australiana]
MDIIPADGFNKAERNTPQKAKPMRKLKSPHWQHFTIKTLEDGSLRAFCKYCNKSLTCGPKAGTSHIARHAKNCRKLLSPSSPCHVSSRPTKNREKLQWKRKTQKPVLGFCSSSLDQNLSRMELAKLLIVHDLPLKLVEQEEFKRFVKSLNPEFGTFQREAIVGDCKSMFELGKTELKQTLRSCDEVSLALKISVSEQDLSFLCITAHYIDESWRMNRKVIGFSMIKNPPEGPTILAIIIRCLEKWGIEGKIFSVTCDDGPLNSAAFKSTLHRPRCCGHILKEIAEGGLRTLADAVGAVRESVKYIRSASSREQVFDQVLTQISLLKKKNLALDVPTQWASTFLMLDSAVYYKRAFLVLGQWDAGYTILPSSEQWKKAEFLCRLLKICHNAANVLSAAKSPTSNLCLHEICAVHNFLRQDVDFKESTVNDMVQALRSKFDLYWGESTLLYAIGTVLDPRFKMLFLEYAFEQIYGRDCAPYVEEVARTLDAAFFDHKERSMRAEAGGRGQEGKKDEDGGCEDDDGMEETEVFIGYNQFLSQQILKEVKSDLDRYLSESVVPLNQKSFDVLRWWSDNSLVYPVLSKMARAYLSIPAVATAVEVPRPDQIGESSASDIVETLVCLQDWLRDDYADGTEDPTPC